MSIGRDFSVGRGVLLEYQGVRPEMVDAKSIAPASISDSMQRYRFATLCLASVFPQPQRKLATIESKPAAWLESESFIMRPSGSEYQHRTHSVSRLRRSSLHVIVLAGSCIAPTGMQAAKPTYSQDNVVSPFPNSFRCPEEFISNEAKESALREFTEAYGAQSPSNSIREMMLERYRLLVSHSCGQTLTNMLKAVSPFSELLRIENRDFGPRTEEFDRKTKIWTVRFRKDGKPPALSEEDLVFNFYGWKPAISAEAIAYAFVDPREYIHILGKFQAPDDVTKAPAYFVVSETLYPNETYGYLNISKITSVGNGTYAVTFARRITGTSPGNIEENGKAWFLSEEGKAITRVINQMGVDPTWERYFAKAHK